MTKLVLFRLVCLILLLGVAGSCRKASVGPVSTEVQNNSPGKTEAPAECIAVFRVFFDYVRKAEPSLITDQEAQGRWLSKLFRKSLAEAIKQAGSPQENPDYPSNGSFVGVWSYPTSFSIIGSRHYDYRNARNPDDNRAVIDVLYEWDENGSLDNQYPGTKALKSFIFVFEDGVWKLDDVYTFSDEYASPESLRAYFSRQ